MSKEHIQNFLKNKNAMIVDPNSTSRNTIRKLLTNFGMTATQVETVDNFSDAKEIFLKQKQQIIFCEHQLGKETGFDLLQVLKENQFDLFENIFVLLTGKNSLYIAGLAGEQNLDSVLIKPFAMEDLEKKWIEIVTEKLKPNHYLKTITQGKKLFEEQKWDEAEALFKKALSEDAVPALAHYWLGQTALKKNDFIKAEKYYQDGLKTDPVHYWCHVGLMTFFFEQGRYGEAFEIATSFSDYHPINPRQIPMLTKLSIVNQKYENVEAYFDVFDDLDQMDPEARRYVSAGMVVCGKHFLKEGNKKRALDAFNRAEKISQGKATIIKGIVVSLLQAGLNDEAGQWMSKAPESLKEDAEISYYGLKHLYDRGQMDEAFNFANQLLRSGKKFPLVYEVLIKRSVELNRKKETILSLIEQGSQDFPDEAKQLASLLPESYSS